MEENPIIYPIHISLVFNQIINHKEDILIILNNYINFIDYFIIYNNCDFYIDSFNYKKYTVKNYFWLYYLQDQVEQINIFNKIDIKEKPFIYEISVLINKKVLHHDFATTYFLNFNLLNLYFNNLNLDYFNGFFFFYYEPFGSLEVIFEPLSFVFLNKGFSSLWLYNYFSNISLISDGVKLNQEWFCFTDINNINFKYLDLNTNFTCHLEKNLIKD